jgi:hypothetical protein
MRPLIGARTWVNSTSSARDGPGPGRGQRGLRGLHGGGQPVDVALRHGFRLEQSPGAAEIGLRQRQVALRARDAGPRLGQRGGERPRIDGEEQLALLDDLAVGEVDADDLAGDARAHLDAAAGLEPADIIVPLLDSCRHVHRAALRPRPARAWAMLSWTS